MTDIEITRTEEFPYGPPDGINRRRELEDELNRIGGIEEISFLPEGIRISYIPQLVSPSIISAELVRLGLVQQTPKRKGLFGCAIDKMAARNEKNFGSQPLDCCSLNRGSDSR